MASRDHAVTLPSVHLLRLLRFLVATGPLSLGLGAERVQIAAASDLVFCLDALNAEFARQESATQVQVATGSSGNFHAQIRNGAPFDLFLSADLRYPRALIDAGVADASSLTPYAIGRIVVWTLRADVDPIDLVTVVRNPQVRRFALANPDHAPYGLAAKQALERAGLWSEVHPKLVLGENISQAAQFVQTGNAEAGIVALSVVLAPPLAGQGRWTLIPETIHDPLKQAAVLTTRGAANPAARRYLAFLRSPEARAVLDRYGFRLPTQP